MFLQLFIIVCILCILYWRKFNAYWINRSVPCAKSTILHDIKMLTIPTKNVGLEIEDIYKKFPNQRFLGFYQLLRPSLMIRDPDLICNIFVKDFVHFYDRLSMTSNSKVGQHLFSMQGQKWKTVRTKLVPTFSSSKLKLMLYMMEHCSKILDTGIKKYTKNDEPIDIREIMYRYTTDVIGTCAFGLEFNSLTDPDSQYRQIGKRVFTPTFKAILGSLIRFASPDFIVKLLKISEVPAEVESFFYDLLKRSEKYRKTETNRRNDLMQLMLDIKESDMNNFSKKTDESDVLFDDKILASNMFLFYLAGFETTASTLTFCLYELGLNAEIQDKVRAEIIKVKADHDGKITYDALKKLTYMDMVFSEVLRKHGPVTAHFRVCTQTYQIPDSDVILHPGDRIIIPVYAIHHDEKYYPDPEKFDPERFSDENNANRRPGTYLPFGDGPRICIGLRFAKVEMKMCLSSLLLKYKFEKCDKTEIPIKINPRGPLYTSKGEIYLKVTEIQERS